MQKFTLWRLYFVASAVHTAFKSYFIWSSELPYCVTEEEMEV